jgi:uncharacterized damage-inducible protein DinB
MTVVDEQGRPEPPLAAGELATLLGFLDFHRATLEWKCSGLDAAGLATTVGASTMTLGGLLKHLALVEDSWLSERLHDRAEVPPWSTVDWDADPDWEWHSAAQDSPEALRALWRESVARSRAAVDEALADGGLDRPADRPARDGSRPTLRWILVHLIEEYARHNGHADLLREQVDGSAGE